VRSAPPRVTGSRIAKEARDRIDLADLVRADGRSQLSDIPTARAVAHRFNLRRDPSSAVHAGDLAALGLLDDLQSALINAYERQVDAAAFGAAERALRRRLGERPVGSTLAASIAAFPPEDILSGQRSPADAVDGATAREAALRDLLVTWLDNANPAVGPLRDLVDDRPVAAEAPPYPRLVAGLDSHFDAAPGFGPEGQSLVDLLRAPALASPTSLAGQLRYIRDNWVELLGDEAADLLGRLQVGLDVIAEEERALHLRFGGGGAGDGFGALVGIGVD